MTLSIRTEITAGLMQVDVAGHPSLAQLLELINQLSSDPRCSQAHALFIRVDVQSVQDQSTKAILGEHIAEQLSRFDKIACVDPRPCDTRAMEIVANRLGVRLSVFDAEEPALRWLESAQ